MLAGLTLWAVVAVHPARASVDRTVDAAVDAAVDVVDDSRLGFGLLLITILIAINAFFVAAEFAMVSVRRSQIDRLVESGDTQARTVQILQRDIDLLLSSTQLGITLSSLALGWTGEQTMAQFVVFLFHYLPTTIAPDPIIAHTIAIPVAFALIAYLQIVLGELCPKSLALLYPEQLARFFGPPSLAIARCFRPFLWAINQSTRFLLRTFGIRISTLTAYNHVTSEELQQIIAKEGEVTGLEAEEREWLSNIFEFGDVTVEEIMTPRTQVCVIESHATIGEVFEEVAESCHSCYPVIGESFDDVRGLICVKDLAEPLTASGDRRDTPITDWIVPVRFVPEYTPLVELMPLLQRSSQTMVMVVDEFGGTAGLVTIQDAIEEIFGDSLYPDSSEEPNVEFIDERQFLVRAQLHVEEANDLLDLNLPVSEDYQTIAGLLIFYMQKIPEVGETFRINDLELSVQSADGPRLERIYIHHIDPNPTSEIDIPDRLIRLVDADGLETNRLKTDLLEDNRLGSESRSQPPPQEPSAPLSPELIAEFTGAAFEDQVPAELTDQQTGDGGDTAPPVVFAPEASPSASVSNTEISDDPQRRLDHSDQSDPSSNSLIAKSSSPDRSTSNQSDTAESDPPKPGVSEQAIHDLRDATLLDSPLAGVPLDWPRRNDSSSDANTTDEND
ncbi:MAG: HlyC/CorC family transporter [Coleofasciculaceae cyanobacterium RL_1_1]|nr:HlyC/CorC family transporter [Coleofasciculaceae cyanobacterium RL_1_1]